MAALFIAFSGKAGRSRTTVVVGPRSLSSPCRVPAHRPDIACLNLPTMHVIEASSPTEKS
jgi:hypothetical protein